MSSKKNKIRVLGAYGSKYRDMNPSTFLINDTVCIDAGNIIEPLKEDIFKISHIFLTHSHFDHISDIPFLLDLTYSKREKPLYLYALKDTINTLKEDLFNQSIWPDFSKIKLPQTGEPALQFIEISYYEEYTVDGIRVKTFPSEHTVPTSGFIINDQILISGDTVSTDVIINQLKENPDIKKVFIDISFPERLEDIAYKSKHHSTKTVRDLIRKLNGHISIYGYHLKPLYAEEIKKELKDERVSFLEEEDRFYFL
ncbi:MAG TPA: hypothetical protein DEP48_04565 [Persephonella sp.]|uniref:Metal dependent phosphohydrolase n=1 Tax=Persephonella marina (strain DSM 14350 / EX-H1) TaxID=123214 RepID=C0QQ29_PERMH|nr:MULTISPECIES: MBL fold metallo-hydrolase [Persephonella]ACO03172.1 metal dependent phosphohydrolase [Persephonella marina EX-H1]HCB69610.1 hypothetical protein [Persephonella sp.]